MTRIHAARAALAAFALAGLGACTVIDEDGGYYSRAAAPGYSYAAPGYGYAASYHGVPDYVAAARAGDTYCREALAAVRQSEAEAAYTGSPEAYARLARARGYASRDC